MQSQTLAAARDAVSDAERGSWFVARTQLRKEHIAKFQLERQGFKVFLPRIERTRRHARKIDTVRVPLFPGYVFVGLELDQSGWRSVNGTLGVMHLLGDRNGRPSQMPKAAMAALFAQCPDELLQHTTDTLKAGDAVLIRTGPFADLVAKVSMLDQRGRVHLLLDILGGGIFQCEANALERV